MARSNNNNKLKAYVRFDGSGRIVSSSLIVQAFKPKVGNWKEIDAKECCNYTTTTTTTAVPTTTTSTTAAPTTTSTTTVAPTTTTTTTPTPGACFCYTISNETAGTLLYTYTDCSSSEYFRTPISADTIVIVCSSTAVTGDAGLVITGGSFSCSTAEDCAG
jgi:hypothetical protein